MELMGAIKALEFANALDAVPIELYTDSEYVMKGMTQWVTGWQERGWRTASKKPVLNQDLWQKLILAADGKDVTWKYVAGHSGHEHNERCDEIATSFADDVYTPLYNGALSQYRPAI